MVDAAVAMENDPLGGVFNVEERDTQADVGQDLC